MYGIHKDLKCRAHIKTSQLIIHHVFFIIAKLSIRKLCTNKCVVCPKIINFILYITMQTYKELVISQLVNSKMCPRQACSELVNKLHHHHEDEALSTFSTEGICSREAKTKNQQFRVLDWPVFRTFGLPAVPLGGQPPPPPPLTGSTTES